MSSNRQIAANRLNAQRSTGPRTSPGKTKVSANALKHGLTAHGVVLPDEDPDDFERFRADLMNSLDPHDALESALAEMIVTNFWRHRRIPKIEALLHELDSAELRVSQAEKLVTQYESTEKDRVLASLEKKKVAARNRQAHDEAQQCLANERGSTRQPRLQCRACVGNLTGAIPEPVASRGCARAILNENTART